MPRTARSLVNSGFYHIMVRGVNKDIIFRDDEDRKLYLRLLRYYISKFNCKVHAYCLMDNHIHILFEDKEFLISDFMRELSSQYAREFNKKYNRVGHLYQERFRSEAIYNGRYLLRLVRYIHRNPEKAGICKTEDYRWSSYKQYIYSASIIEKSYILSKFNLDYAKSIEEFKKFVLNENEDNIDKLYLSKHLTDEQAIELIRYETGINKIEEIKKYKKDKRKEVLKQILEIKNLNYSQISRVLGIGKNFKSKI